MRQEQRQRKALQALASAKSLTEAAELAGISRRTLYTYLRDERFAKELERYYTGCLVETVSDLDVLKKKAEETLSALLDDPSPELRLRAAKAIIDYAGKREAVMLRAITKIQDEDDGIFPSFLRR